MPTAYTTFNDYPTLEIVVDVGLRRTQVTIDLYGQIQAVAQGQNHTTFAELFKYFCTARKSMDDSRLG